MKVKLKNIANLSLGVFLKPSPKGTINYLQGKDFEDDGLPSKDYKPTFIEDNAKNKRYFLKEGDILLAAKGTRHFASVIDGSFRKTIASSTFIILNVIDEFEVNPRYLCWYLNYLNNQKFFNRLAMGSSIPSISKDELGQVKIPLPPIEKQIDIVRLQDLWFAERRLLEALIGEKERFYQNLSLELSNSKNNG